MVLPRGLGTTAMVKYLLELLAFYRCFQGMGPVCKVSNKEEHPVLSNETMFSNGFWASLVPKYLINIESLASSVPMFLFSHNIS